MSHRFRARAVGAVLAVGTAAGVIAATPQVAAAPQLNWGPCAKIHDADKAQCATIKVPRDYANPHGPTIDVTISRLPARDPSRKRGVLVGNPGGPGGDAIGLFQWAPPPAAVRDEFDLVAVQPRGLVGGTPLECAPFTAADDFEALANYGAINRNRCEKASGGYVRTITTENTARDIEMARRALGVGKLSLWGVSYGTTLMSTYATLYPQHTDRLILDSAVNPDGIWNDMGLVQTPGYKARVNAMMVWIAQHDNIYHLGKTPLSVYRKWSARVTREAGVPPSLAAPPAQVGDVPPGLRAWSDLYLAGTNLTAASRAAYENFVATMLTGKNQATSSMLSATRIVAPNRDLWPIVALRLAGKVPTPKKRQLSAPEKAATTASNNMFDAILCNENQFPARPELIPAAVYTNLISGDIFEAPGLFRASGIGCAGAPAIVRPVRTYNRGLPVQPLLINSLGDPQTPYAGALRLRDAMRAHLITVGGGDHGQIGRDNPKLNAAIAQYLTTGHTGVTYTDQARITNPLDRLPAPSGSTGIGPALPVD
ncbi:alpha/beta fold hydrolase [Gordonia sp. ABSL1-1]|uniref:alpha/beta fold hydrolase n=1 Tax=Gordonia sp. ABSL1-1 TaxID=3053923 RepID=UPI00257405E1|nr:alpha/beta fold hydrolase [Gordonia sp. ABSL1-1]MDL9937596.1 alpha/beta fold hydrolase [Gordonia sp. ABSL1-1]